MKTCGDDDPLARLVDPTGGRADLAAGVLKPAGPGVLSDDPLRVLRAFRFMSTHGFTLAPGMEYALDAASAGTLQGGVRTHRGGMAAPHGRSAGRAGGAGHGGLRGAHPLGAGAGRRAGTGSKPLPSPGCAGAQFGLRAGSRSAPGRAGPLGRGLGGRGACLFKRAAPAGLVYDRRALARPGQTPHRRAKDDEWATFYRHEMVGAKLAAARCRALDYPRQTRPG